MVHYRPLRPNFFAETAKLDALFFGTATAIQSSLWDTLRVQMKT